MTAEASPKGSEGRRSDPALLRARAAYGELATALRSAGGLEEARAAFERISATLPIADDVVSEPTEAGGVRAAWISVPESDDRRVLLFLHGGGYVSGSIASHRSLMASVARAARGRVLGIDYRRAPEHTFPAALDDATAAFRWLRDTLGGSTTIVLVGDSAGGGLVMATLLALRDARDELPRAAICIGPWVDLALTSPSLLANAACDPVVRAEGLAGSAGRYLGATDPTNPLASPLYGDLHGLPPLLIQVGGDEALLDDGRRLAQKAADAGVRIRLEVWPEMMHSWHQYADFLPDARAALRSIGHFVDEVSSEHSPSR